MKETREFLLKQKHYTEGVIDGLRLSTAWLDKKWSKKEDEYMKILSEIEKKIDESIEEEYQDWMNAPMGKNEVSK